MRKASSEEIIELMRIDPLLKYKELRSEDVNGYYVVTRNPSKTALSRTKQLIRSNVLSFYEDGLGAYQYLFDRASIYYTATAVEIGLAYKLRLKIKQEKERNSHLNFDFKWLIKNSNLDEKTRDLADDIRIMRNCYIHYQNFLAYYAKTRLVDVPELIKAGVLRPEVNEVIIGDKDNTPIRLEHLESQKEVMPFINRRITEHINWIGSVIPRMIEYKRNLGETNGLNLQELLSVFGQQAFDALDCIKWSLTLLKALYIF
ncbi:hypothetical protein ACFLX8_04540 [Chloroflexota bacterium]